ncbi:MAG TPA: hypothetical protein VFR03_07595 [Thermoanaerobaculia bacterium]|nr:hypothetical protein [Thermoanaerobaculia bacterium]
MPHRLVYLCDWLPPDFGAVGQYSLLFARQRAAQGDDVVLAGLSSTAGSVEEERHGEGRLRIVRLRAATYDRADFRTRALWTARTDLGLVWRLRKELRAADEILFTGSPPFLIQLLVPLNLLLRKRLTYRITDFHPECLMAEMENDGRRIPAPLRLFHRWTVALRRRVDRFEVLGEDQRKRLLEIGIDPGRIVLKRDPSPVEIPPGTAPLARPAELGGYAVLLYSGNFGVAHDHETFVEGYRRHHREGVGRVALWLNATGAKADRVEEILRREGLPLHRGRPVPLAELPRLLVTPDAHLITLRDAFVGYVLPSKVYGCVQSGRGVLYVGSPASDVHLLCAREIPPERYWRADTGDPAGVLAALEEIGRLHKARESVRYGA